MNGPHKGRAKESARVEAGLAKYQASKTWADTLRWPLTIGSFGIPLMPVYWAVDSLAGRHTTVEVSLLVTITAALSLTMTGVSGVLLAKNRAQKTELERLRGRVQTQEAILRERGKEAK